MNSENNHYESTHKTTYDLHSKIMLIAIFSLLFVILLVIILYIYARCVLRHPRRNPASTFIYPNLTPQHAEPKSGLDPTVIRLLPSFQFRHMEGQDDHTECAVCLSMLEEDELARRLPNCNHVFHMACIDRWLTGQSNCPICRSEATPQLAPLGREPPTGSDHLTEVVVVVTSETELDESTSNDDLQVVINSDNNGSTFSKNNNGSGSSLSSSFRLSSFRKIISREKSSSSSRLHVCGEIDQQRQFQQ